MTSTYVTPNTIIDKDDARPTSLVGRFWRWHINFCPGWKAYFNSLSDDEKDGIRQKYNFTNFDLSL